jgi:hypothetical protein
MPTTFIYKYNITADVTLGGTTETLSNIAACSTTFAVNSLPSASITIAVGNTSRADFATIDLLQRMQSQQDVPLKLYIRWPNLTGVGDPTVTKLLFEGEISGFGWSRTGEAASMHIHVRHWLHYLNFASALTSALHPGSPANLSRAALEKEVTLDSITRSVGNTAGSGWVSNLAGESLNSAAATDLWDFLILPFLTDIAESEQFGPDANTNLTVNAAFNAKIVAALARLKHASLPASANGKGELALRLTDALGVQLADTTETLNRILDGVLDRTSAGFVYNTLWSKLVGEYAPMLQFEVAPRVSDAVIAPAIGGYRGASVYDFELGDNARLDLSGEVEQPLRAVSLVFPFEGQTGIDNNLSPTLVDAGATYGTYSVDRPGMTLFKQPPPWLIFGIGSGGGDAEGQQSNGPSPTAAPTNTGTVSTSVDGAPNAGNVNTNNSQPGDAHDNKVKEARSLASLYAQQLFNNESLRSRLGSLTTPPIYTAAPGSHISIQMPPELASVQPFGAPNRDRIFAKVVQVTTMFDAQSGAAGSTFTLSHCRTGTEDLLDNYTIEEPALYNKGWIGGPL